MDETSEEADGVSFEETDDSQNEEGYLTEPVELSQAQDEGIPQMDEQVLLDQMNQELAYYDGMRTLTQNISEFEEDEGEGGNYEDEDEIENEIGGEGNLEEETIFVSPVKYVKFGSLGEEAKDEDSTRPVTYHSYYEMDDYDHLIDDDILEENEQILEFARQFDDFSFGEDGEANDEGIKKYDSILSEREAEEENYEILGEDKFDGEGEEKIPPKKPKIPNKEITDQEFLELYMQIPECGAEKALSNAVLDLECLTPPFPITPTKTKRAFDRCPSIESFLKIDFCVQGTFVVVTGQRLFCRELRRDLTIGEIKYLIAPFVKVPKEYIELRRNLNILIDSLTIGDLIKHGKNKMIFTVDVKRRMKKFFSVQIPDKEGLIIQPEQIQPPIVQRVTLPGGGFLTVKVEYPTELKPYIGGYRNLKTGIIYHNAFTNTIIEKIPYKKTDEHKSCQTFNDKESSTQDSVTTYTQTKRPDYHLLCQGEKVLYYSGYYLTASNWEARRLYAVVTIQRAWRKFMAIREKTERLNTLVKRIQWAENFKSGRSAFRKAIQDDEFWRQRCPRRLQDLELLYRAINEWKKCELEYIHENRWGAEKKAAIAMITEEEMSLLLDLERVKNKLKARLAPKVKNSTFGKMVLPKRFLTRSGKFIQIIDDTPEKDYVKLLYGIFIDLQRKDITNEARIQVLRDVFDTLKDYPIAASGGKSKILLDLVLREVTLLQETKNLSQDLLIGLRKRILNAYYNLCMDVGFNPQSKSLKSAPCEGHKLKNEMRRCKSCNQMKYREEFAIARGSNLSSRCLICSRMNQIEVLRYDMNLYRNMLDELCIDEHKAGVKASIAFIINEEDIRFLVEQIWHGQSILSGMNDRFMLRLCRWRREFPWSPWNSVLLSDNEAVSHLKIENLEEAYQESFFNKVSLLHSESRYLFARSGRLALTLDPPLERFCLDRKPWNFRSDCVMRMTEAATTTTD